MRVCFKTWPTLTVLSFLLSTACTGSDTPDIASEAAAKRQAVATDLVVTVDGKDIAHDKLEAELDGKPATLEDALKVLGDNEAKGKEVLVDRNGETVPVDGASSMLSVETLGFEGLSKILEEATDGVYVCSTFPVKDSLIQMCVLLLPAHLKKEEDEATKEALAKAKRMSSLMDDLAKRYPDPDEIDYDSFVQREAAQLEEIATLYCEASGLKAPCSPTSDKSEKTGGSSQLSPPWWVDFFRDIVSRAGVIPNNASCPSGISRVEIYHDDEDNRNNNHHWGWLGGIFQDRNTLFRFCNVAGNNFRSLIPRGAQYNYAVLRLGLFCPAGTAYATWRYFDNEDWNNQNRTSGSLFPNVNVLGRNQVMAFCVLEGGPNVYQMSGFANLGFSYGVFAPSNMPSPYRLQAGSLYKDDEDIWNADFWVNGPGPGMGERDNTSMDLVRVR
jgi:hypothetical protein